MCLIMDDTTGETPAIPQAMTRQKLMDGSLHRMFLTTPGLVFLTDEEREKSWRDMLDNRPDHGQGVWLFAYGSLIWNPMIHYVESRFARIEGWRRSFCLSAVVGRGTPDQPGLFLGLDSGGQCEGVAYRIAEDTLLEEIAVVWAREMPSGAYIPKWVPLHDQDGHVFGSGIAFTINPAGPHYMATLPEADAVQRLATAHGVLGSASDYLFQTQAGLCQMGIEDPMVDQLAEAVIQAQAKV
jgi:cation transport protein ChaC